MYNKVLIMKPVHEELLPIQEKITDMVATPLEIGEIVLHLRLEITRYFDSWRYCTKNMGEGILLSHNTIDILFIPPALSFILVDIVMGM